MKHGVLIRSPLTKRADWRWYLEQAGKTAVAMWRRVGGSSKASSCSTWLKAGQAHARAQDAIEAERRRRMARWPKGVALWKLAPRLLAVERPSLWRVAELHAHTFANFEHWRLLFLA